MNFGGNRFRAEKWGSLPDGREWGSVSAIEVDSDGERIWVAERCGANSCVEKLDCDPVILLDKHGNVVRSFGRGMLAWPHSIHVDGNGDIWIADGAFGQIAESGLKFGIGHRVLKFSATGFLLMVLGKGGSCGKDKNLFNGPCDVITDSVGSIYVADGHLDDGTGNDRIVKFSSNGEYLMEWGSSGTALSQFLGPHALAADSEDRIYVADRGNSRIQIFDSSGKYLIRWTQFGKPSGIYIEKFSGTIYVADSESATDHRHPNPGWDRGIRVGSVHTGWVTDFILWDATGEDPDRKSPGPRGSGAEGVTADKYGNIFLGVVRTPEMNILKYHKIKHFKK
jgi:DNA-binding beta-propeller fold protein YncE